MKRNPLVDESLARYSSHKSESWTLGLVCGIFMAGIMALGFIAPSVQFWLVPFIILPFFFACIFCHMGFEFNQILTFKSHFRYFRVYFTPMFWSSFSFFRSLLRALIGFFIVLLISSSVGTLIIKTIDWDGFLDALAQFEEYYTQTTTVTIDELNDILSINDGILYRYAALSLLPAFNIGVLVFFYFVLRSSLSIYLKTSLTNIDPRINRLVFNRTLSKNRKRFFKNFWALNWPLFVLMFSGLIIGELAMTIRTWDTSTLLSTGLCVGLFLTSFFWPFYFSNMEVLFKDMKDSFLDNSDDIKKELLRTLDENIAIAKEQRERMEDIINGFNNRNRDGNDDDK